MAKRGPKWPWLVVSAVIAIQAAQLALHSVGRPGFGTDFQLLYTVSMAWSQHRDTYDDATLKETWRAHGDRTLPIPGRPITPNVYPLTVAPLIWPMTHLPFHAAILLWAAVVLGSEAYLIVYILRASLPRGDNQGIRRIAVALAVAILMLCYPIRLNLASLNIGLPMAALAVAALHVANLPSRAKGLARHRAWVAGVAMGIALVKYSVTGPLLLLMVWRRQYRAVGTALAVQLGLVAIATWAGGYNHPLEWVGAMRSEIAYSLAPGEINAYDAEKGAAMHLHLRSLWHRLSPGNDTWHGLLVIGLFIVPAACVLRRQPGGSSAGTVPVVEAAVLLLLTLASFYHRAYDLIPAMVLVMAWLVRALPARSGGRVQEWFIWGLMAITIAPGLWDGWDAATAPTWVRLCVQPACAWATCLAIPLLSWVALRPRPGGHANGIP